MNDKFLSITFNILKNIVIILFIVFLVSFVFFIQLYSSYDKNIFSVKLNETEMKCYYSEKYNIAFLNVANSQGYNSVENEINEIELKNIIKLEINEYEEYYNNGYKKNNNFNWFFNDNMKYQKTDNNINRVVIYRMNKVLYDGVPLENYSNIINEKGRYYFHVYSKRKVGFLRAIKTHISFNVIVGGGNYA